MEVTGWAWNKRTKTKTMMTATRMSVVDAVRDIKCYKF